LETYLQQVPHGFVDAQASSWNRKGFDIRKVPLDEFREEAGKVLPPNYDFAIHKKKGEWPGDTLAKKVDRKNDGFQKVYDDSKIDEVAGLIEKPSIKDRVVYRKYSEEDFWEECLKDTSIAAERRKETM
jgi:hypothetical protein